MISRKLKDRFLHCPLDPTIYILTFLLLIRLGLQLILYRVGFQSLTADEFGRTVISAQWAIHPNIIWEGFWLPFDYYLLGTGLKIWWNLLITPRVITIGFGLTSIVFMYFVATEVFHKTRIGYLSALLLAVNPLHIWLSSTPLTEIIHTTFVLIALFGLVRYLKSKNKKYLFLAVLMLGLANGFRFEAWMVSTLFSLFILGYGSWMIRKGIYTFNQFLGLAIVAIIPWVFPAIWSIKGYLSTGNPLYFMEIVNAYKNTWYGQSHSYINYVKPLLFIDPFACIIFIAGIFFLFGKQKKQMDVTTNAYLAIAVLPALLFFYLHGGQSEPFGNYLRYLAPFVFLTYPLVAWFIDQVSELISINQKRYLPLMIFVMVLTLPQLWKTFNFTNDPSASGISIGEKIKQIRHNDPSIKSDPVIIEVSYWQYLSIQVGADDVSNILLDRELDFDHRSTRSIFYSDTETLLNYFTENHVSYLIVKSDDLQKIIENKLGILPSDKVGDWIFYKIPNSFRGSASTNSFVR